MTVDSNHSKPKRYDFNPVSNPFLIPAFFGLMTGFAAHLILNALPVTEDRRADLKTAFHERSFDDFDPTLEAWAKANDLPEAPSLKPQRDLDNKPR